MNVTLPPSILPITIRCAFFAALLCISSTNSSGNFASSSKLRSIGNGPWLSAPRGEVDPGPLPECIISFRFGGAFVGAIEFLLTLFLPLEVLALASEASSLDTCLAAMVLTFSCARPLLDDRTRKLRNAGRREGVIDEYLSVGEFARCLGHARSSSSRDVLSDEHGR